MGIISKVSTVRNYGLRFRGHLIMKPMKLKPQALIEPETSLHPTLSSLNLS